MPLPRCIGCGGPADAVVPWLGRRWACWNLVRLLRANRVMSSSMRLLSFNAKDSGALELLARALERHGTFDETVHEPGQEGVEE